ncbi:M55 family metallopeptidase [Bacillus horti]|uniref:D-amino peptidase n=1 Tax=Caldalkalibacillus horti TaxID=77523 RepID=A0ABT9W2M7_9BACI|nr:M55 family metallopeptidase [Bacillus horti]MDQ0167493.1 D-amino peptidase [Bacillus horti]
MKVFISVDMEGISGVATGQQMQDPEYGRFRKLMTQDTNAAIAGAFEAGATEVLVGDSHGNMSNILIEELDPRARLISGSNKLLCQMEGIDETFDAAYFVGYHGREGGSERAVINHTISGLCVTEIRINGRPVGEAEINAGIAGYYGVPCVLITGDDVLAEEVKETLPDIEAAIVKRGIDRFTAELLSPQHAQEIIKEKAKLGLQKAKSIKPYQVAGKVTFEIEFKLTNQAQMCTLFPTVELISPKTIRIETDDYVVGYKQLWGCLILGMKATRSVLGG